MRLAIFGFVLFLSQSVFAQVPAGCDMRTNPHSFVCTKWTFDGNQIFPLFDMDWNNTLQGEWMPLTYAHPTMDTNGPDFVMMVNPQRHSIPVAVIDRITNAQLGNFVFNGDLVSLNNWRGGVNLQSTPSSLVFPDRWTARFLVQEGDHWHAFNCRDFNRNRNHHLLCAWDIKRPNVKDWEHRGFLGFLKVR